MEELKLADRVKLNSGGPEMSILRFIGTDKQTRISDDYLKKQGYKDGDVVCQWFEENKLLSGNFKRESLRVVKTP